jgi:hypothetical protein
MKSTTDKKERVATLTPGDDADRRNESDYNDDR